MLMMRVLGEEGEERVRQRATVAFNIPGLMKS